MRSELLGTLRRRDAGGRRDTYSAHEGLEHDSTSVHLLRGRAIGIEVGHRRGVSATSSSSARTATPTLDMNISPGRCFPLGATPVQGGANFSVFSSQASRLELLLFDGVCDAEPARVICLDAGRHRTYHYWHAFVPGLRPGQAYAYRAVGAFDPARGLRFDPAKALLDPYGRAVVVPDGYARVAASRPGDNTRFAMRSVVVDPDSYDWQGDTQLRQPFATTVIYEMHVAGFTRHPSSGVGPGARGTYAGMIERIPYLQDLGITAVELLPVFQFDAQDAPPGLVNYWGYSPVSFFAPHAAYSSRRDPLGPVDEFRDLVKALHRAGIEVILDVVYNHTAEGSHEGPTLSFRGLDNETYYLLQADRSRYADYTGTGNTLNANNAVVRRLILDSLRYWVSHMHVDGFRFDLASVLSRDESGCPLQRPPILWDIQSDPILAGTKLIAEAWDAAGLYQVGQLRRRRLAGVEREVPRRRPSLRQVRQRYGRRVRVPLLRQPGCLRAGGPGAGAERQLRHVARRVHAERPSELQREAQRVKRRGRPRRVRRELQLELRDRGADRRSRDRAIAPSPGEELPGHHAAIARHAHAADG